MLCAYHSIPLLFHFLIPHKKSARTLSLSRLFLIENFDTAIRLNNIAFYRNMRLLFHFSHLESSFIRKTDQISNYFRTNKISLDSVLVDWISFYLLITTKIVSTVFFFFTIKHYRINQFRTDFLLNVDRRGTCEMVNDHQTNEHATQQHERSHSTTQFFDCRCSVFEFRFLSPSTFFLSISFLCFTRRASSFSCALKPNVCAVQNVAIDLDRLKRKI